MGLNIIITGGLGLIAQALKKQLDPSRNVWCPSRERLDVTNYKLCFKTLTEYPKPDLVIHCGGYTSMDKAETDEEECFRVNALGTENIAICCNHLDIPMFYFSTDAVFDGTKAEAYTTWDKPNPISVYGRSKLAGEEAIQRHLTKFWILRTTGVYGSSRSNYITDAIDKLEAGERHFSTLMDQLSTPTYVNDLVKVVENLIDSKRFGVYHYTNEGLANRWRVISKIADHLGIKEELTFSDYKVKALRPMNARLKDNTNSYNRPWQEALKEFINEHN